MVQRGTVRITKPRQLVIDWLNSQGGEKVSPDKKGLSSPGCREEAGYTGSKTGWPSLLQSMEIDGIIRREVNGKRTLGLYLLPPFLESDAGAQVSMEATATVSTEPEPEPEPERTSEDELLDNLVDRILLRFLERLTSRPEAREVVRTVVESASDRENMLEQELNGLKERLAATLADAQRNRTKLRTAEDAAKAAAEQATQLRRDVGNLQANLDALTKPIDPSMDRRRAETEKLMEAPHIARGRRGYHT